MVATVSAVAGGEAAGHEATAQESTTSMTTTAMQGEDSTAGEPRVQQAPALPGAQAISSSDRVYTADQSSNTVTVIDPSANDNEGEVLGTISLGQPRLDGVLDPVDRNQVNTHGLGFSPDGRFLDVVDVTSNATQIVDTSSNKVVQTSYVGRSPHEAFISPDATPVWIAVRGEDYVSVTSLDSGEEVDRIETAKGPSKVVFSPDGEQAFVNHFDASELDVIDVASREVIDRIAIPDQAGSPDDGQDDRGECWRAHGGGSARHRTADQPPELRHQRGWRRAGLRHRRRREKDPGVSPLRGRRRARDGDRDREQRREPARYLAEPGQRPNLCGAAEIRCRGRNRYTH